MKEDARRAPGNRCQICGQPDDLLRQLDWANNTCSAECARTAAIVQVLGGLIIAFKDWREELRRAIVDVNALSDGVVTKIEPHDVG
jgi:ribosomal protein S14